MLTFVVILSFETRIGWNLSMMMRGSPIIFVRCFERLIDVGVSGHFDGSLVVA